MATFTYRDGRFFKDGAPFYFLGAEYQYYRDKRSNWAARLDQLKAGNVNVICFYIPWRHHIVHDPVTGAVSYDFDGRTFDSRDLRTFLKLCQERGLQMLAKPGPFVHSELNIGGLPDISSPTFNPGIEPVRLQNGDPLFWEYDHTQMPSPNDATFDALAKRWLSEVGKVLAPYVAPKGNWSGPESTPAAARKIASAIPLPPPACSGQIIAIQLLDETIYCTSNDAPWHFGYDAPDQRHFQAMLAAKYGTVVEYNRVHGTAVKAFQFVVPPRLDPTQGLCRAGIVVTPLEGRVDQDEPPPLPFRGVRRLTCRARRLPRVWRRPPAGARRGGKALRQRGGGSKGWRSGDL